MSDELIKNILLESEKLFNFDSGNRAYLTLDRNNIGFWKFKKNNFS